RELLWPPPCRSRDSSLWGRAPRDSSLPGHTSRVTSSDMRLALALIALSACGGAATPPSQPAPVPTPPPPMDPVVDHTQAGTPGSVAPPKAARRPHEVVAPSGTRDDPYYWLRDDTRQDKDVLAYLNAE